MKSKIFNLVFCFFLAGCAYDPPMGKYYFQINNNLNNDFYCNISFDRDFFRIDTPVIYDGLGGVPKQEQTIFLSEKYNSYLGKIEEWKYYCDSSNVKQIHFRLFKKEVVDSLGWEKGMEEKQILKEFIMTTGHLDSIYWNIDLEEVLGK
ncbi:hypothetical protein ACR78F_04940 [Sphingobacterium spiritivorum]|uniref:hypothetical protein n=1 Tax=Sphingobacterium spiritivorum TaxID=258 RepID=UPI003DA4F9A0